MAEQEVDALLGEGFLQGDGNLRVLDGEEVRQHLDDGHLGAEGVEEVGELNPDRTGADNDDGLGLLGKDESLLGADDGLAVEGQSGQGTGDAAGGHEDILGRVRLLGTVGGFDDYFASLVDAGFPAEEIDLVLLEEEIEAAGSLLRNVAGALDDFIPVVLEAGDLEAELGRAMAHLVVELGVLEQGLGRDASPVVAGAPAALDVDNGDFLSKLGGADRADISGGTGADDDEVVGCRGHKKPSFLRKREAIGKAALVRGSCASMVSAWKSHSACRGRSPFFPSPVASTPSLLQSSRSVSRLCWMILWARGISSLRDPHSPM